MGAADAEKAAAQQLAFNEALLETKLLPEANAAAQAVVFAADRAALNRHSVPADLDEFGFWRPSGRSNAGWLGGETE